jgi:predicted hotdog family 3-hydroxylacyl-ACP dehydratase
MLIDKMRLQELIPHTGAMCLLDGVTAWDDDSIQCITNTHRDPSNPLRWQDRLSAIAVFEYGAQAAAVHGGLCARAVGEAAAPGYLVALRNARWFVAELDEIAAPLQISARRLLGEAAQSIYTIQVSAAGRLLAEARVTIMPQPTQQRSSPPLPRASEGGSL